MFDYDGDLRPIPVDSAPDIGAQENLLANPNSIYFGDYSVPQKIILSQNYPNPFNPKTSIQFSMPKSELVTLVIYNVLGMEITTLISENLTAGKHKYVWNASQFASGVYFYKLQIEKFTQLKKIILIR